jgi:RNA recognition motif-containing protein
MKFFLKFGRVGEIYIPKKLDNRGRRFGFVKFKEVKDVGQLSERLRDVWIGTFKLIVNRSRFARSESKEAPSQEVSSERPNLKLKEAEVGRSFQMALMGGGRLS